MEQQEEDATNEHEGRDIGAECSLVPPQDRGERGAAPGEYEDDPQERESGHATDRCNDQRDPRRHETHCPFPQPSPRQDCQAVRIVRRNLVQPKTPPYGMEPRTD